MCHSARCQQCYWEQERQSPGLMVFMKNIRENWLSDRKRKTTLLWMLEWDPGFSWKTSVDLENQRDLEREGTKRSTLTNTSQFSLLTASSKLFYPVWGKSRKLFFLSLKSLLSPLQVSFPCNCPSGASLKGHVTSSSANRVIPGRPFSAWPHPPWFHCTHDPSGWFLQVLFSSAISTKGRKVFFFIKNLDDRIVWSPGHRVPCLKN